MLSYASSTCGTKPGDLRISIYSGRFDVKKLNLKSSSLEAALKIYQEPPLLLVLDRDIQF